MNSYSVKLDAFEGPLDLLLHLINQAEVDIYDIPVAEITEQYMNYVRSMQQLELDIASEYLVMAATLLMIKSKTLLPKQEEALLQDEWQMEEEDPRDELINKLVEYRKFKEAASAFKELEQERSLIYMRMPEDLDEYITDEERRKVEVQGVSLFDMLSAYQKLLKRKELQAPRLTTIKSEEYSVEEKMNEVLDKIEKKNGECRFEELFTVWERGHVVVTFLAILELMKTRTIQCVQIDNFSDIMIYSFDMSEVGHIE